MTSLTKRNQSFMMAFHCCERKREIDGVRLCAQIVCVALVNAKKYEFLFDLRVFLFPPLNGIFISLVLNFSHAIRSLGRKKK